jgi:hypothetical protein
MDRGTNYAAMITVVMNCQICLMGSAPNSLPPFDLDLFIHCCSLIPFLLFNIIFVFLRFHSHSVLYDQYYTWNSPTFRVRSPRPHSHQFRLTNSAFYSHSFCLSTSLLTLPVKSPYLTRSFISQFYKKDGQLYVSGICRGVRRGQASASRS